MPVIVINNPARCSYAAARRGELGIQETIKDSFIMELVPFISVGEFKFNTNIDNYKLIHNFIIPLVMIRLDGTNIN